MHAVHMWARMYACRHAPMHTIHICICIHARMYACWHAYACRNAHTRTIHICICGHGHMSVCGHMRCACGHTYAGRHGHTHTIHIWICIHGMMWVGGASHMWTCTCACGVLMVLVSGFLCRCLARTHLRIYLPGIPVSTRTHHAPHMGGAPAGVVPHVLWIVDHACICAAHACGTHTCTRGGRLLPCSGAQGGGACWVGAPWVVDHACMCTTRIHTYACTQHMHVHGMLTHV